MKHDAAVESPWLTSWLQKDVDDILSDVRNLSSRERTVLMLEAIKALQVLDVPVRRAKALAIVQEVMAIAENGRLAQPAAERAAVVLTKLSAPQNPSTEERKVAFRALALLFLKARTLTNTIDDAVRRTYRRALHDMDVSFREDANEALSPGGVLGRRKLRAEIATVPTPRPLKVGSR